MISAKITSRRKKYKIHTTWRIKWYSLYLTEWILAQKGQIMLIELPILKFWSKSMPLWKNLKIKSPPPIVRVKYKWQVTITPASIVLLLLLLLLLVYKLWVRNWDRTHRDFFIENKTKKFPIETWNEFLFVLLFNTPLAALRIFLESKISIMHVIHTWISKSCVFLLDTCTNNNFEIFRYSILEYILLLRIFSNK